MFVRVVLVLDRVMPSTNFTHDDLYGAGQDQMRAEAKIVEDIAQAVTERVAAKNVETRKIDAWRHGRSFDKRGGRKVALAHFSSHTVQLLLDRCNELSRSARDLFDAQPVVNKHQTIVDATSRFIAQGGHGSVTRVGAL